MQHVSIDVRATARAPHATPNRRAPGTTPARERDHANPPARTPQRDGWVDATMRHSPRSTDPEYLAGYEDGFDLLIDIVRTREDVWPAVMP